MFEQTLGLCAGMGYGILLLSSSNGELEGKKQLSRGVNNICQRKCPCCAGVFMFRALVRPRAHGGGGLRMLNILENSSL